MDAEKPDGGRSRSPNSIRLTRSRFNCFCVRGPVSSPAHAETHSAFSPLGTLLDRILKPRNSREVVPQLRPEVLHRLIQHCGLEDCGELLALATPGS